MSKHIVIDGRHLRSSTGRYVRKLLEYLEKIDTTNRYTVLVTPEDADQWQPTVENFTKKIVPYAHYSIGEQLGLRRVLKDLQPDLVHFTMPQQPYFYTGKSITTVHDMTLVNFANKRKSALVYTVRQLIFKRLLKKVLKRSLHILAPTKNSKAEIIAFGPKKMGIVDVIYLSADPIEEHPIPINALKNKAFLLYVGTAHAHKNLRALTDGFVDLKKSHPDLHLVFAGKIDYRYEQLQEHVAHANIPDVHVLGFVEDASLRWLYENAACYVFPSLSEGFGFPPIEAMHYGLPVAASGASCIPEVCGPAAVYFDPDTKDELVVATNEILTNKTARGDLVRAGAQQIKKYSWKKTATQTHQVYLESLR